MAKQPGYQSRSTNSGTGELKSRLLFVLGALIVYRIGSFIPLPGIDAAVLAQLVEQQKGTIIDMLNMFSGGALSRASILALGIMPYISASIVMQLLATVSPALAELKKEGAAGQRKITKYTRYATVVFATIQAIAISTGLPNMLPQLVPNIGFTFYFTAVVSLASSIILFPATLTQWFGQNDKFEWLNDLSMLLNPGQPLYLLVYAVAIIFFSFFYTAMQYNPRDTADNLKKSGAFIPGIRPGEQTSRYIDKVMTRLTLIGGLYVTFVCLVPYIMTSAWDVKFYFGGTSLLIVVVVIMDFIVQVQSHLMSSQYESALKKANLKGFGQ